MNATNLTVKVGDYLTPVNEGRRRIFDRVLRVTPKRAYIAKDEWVDLETGFSAGGSQRRVMRLATPEELAEKQRQDDEIRAEYEAEARKRETPLYKLASYVNGYFACQSTEETQELGMDKLERIKAILDEPSMAFEDA